MSQPGLSLDDEALALYRRARAYWLVGDERTALKYHRQIRAEHSVEMWPGVELPPMAEDGRETVRLVHPLGSVLGKAAYAPGLVVYQGVSVGSTVDAPGGDSPEGRPRFEGPVVLFPHSAVLGNIIIGSNVWITAGTIVRGDRAVLIRVPDNVIVMPEPQSACGAAWKPTKRSVLERFFKEAAAPPAASPHQLTEIDLLPGESVAQACNRLGIG